MVVDVERVIPTSASSKCAIQKLGSSLMLMSEQEMAFLYAAKCSIQQISHRYHLSSVVKRVIEVVWTTLIR